MAALLHQSVDCKHPALGRPPHNVTEANFQKNDLLLHSLYDAALHTERVTMKLEYVATALRRQFISYDSAINWLSDLDLLHYVLRPEFSYGAVQ